MLKVFCLNFRFKFAETRATRFNQLNRFMFFPFETCLCLFSRAWHQLHVFPRLASVACFPPLGICCMFSRAWHQLHVFSRLASVACFPALGICCMFSRAWHQLHVFLHLAPVAWHWLNSFPCLARDLRHSAGPVAYD